MFGATVAVPLLLASLMELTPEDTAKLVCIQFFCAGITTLLQTWKKVGSGLPIVQGSSFSFLGPLVAIIATCKSMGIRGSEILLYTTGAIIGASFFEIVIGYSGLAGLLRRYITPVSIGPTIIVIGLSLADVGASQASGNWGLALLTVVLIVLFSQVLGRRYRIFMLFPVVLGVMISYVVALLLSITGFLKPGDPGYVNLRPLMELPWLNIPKPFPWGLPKFVPAFILGMLAAYVASMVESIGDYHTVCRVSEAPPPDEKTISKGLGAEGLGCLIGGIFGCAGGYTSYSENIGVIGLVRVASRYVIQLGAVFMLLMGFFGKFGALMATIPKPIIGGLYLVVFGMIAAVGASLLTLIDLKSPRNLLIVGMSLYLGLSVPMWMKGYNPYGVKGRGAIVALLPPQLMWLGEIVEIILETGMAVAAIVGIVLDNLIPGTPEERGLTHPEWCGKVMNKRENK
ncbi:MAG: xanthine permease [Thermoprotei archaeon]|nr:MAG: xanthine permease [Thermoprotei archaeon]RLE56739.1 MAG: xanthine permease [Thermoprotei archaeon]